MEGKIMGFFDKLKNGLNKTKTSFDEKMNNIFSNFRKVDEELLEELEEALIMSDVGANTSSTIIEKLRERIKKDNIKTEKEANKKIEALSKGYKQRVGIAQALIHDPKVLILDEPTTGLDPNQLVEIRNLIKQIGKTKTILLSTHIMQEVEAVCSRVIIINNGRLVADDETKHLSAGGSLEKTFREITANI